MPPLPGSFARARPGEIVALAALVLLAPTAAEAGCRHPAGDATRAARFDRLARSGALAAIGTPEAPAPDAPRPCSGSFCSRRDAGSPLAPKVPPARPRDPGEALGSIVLMAVAGRPIARAKAGDDLRPVDLGPSIFHPPRPSQPC